MNQNQLQEVWKTEANPDTVEQLLEECAGLIGVDVDFETTVQAGPFTPEEVDDAPYVDGDIWAIQFIEEDRALYTSYEGVFRFVLMAHSHAHCEEMKTIWNSGTSGKMTKKEEVCGNIADRMRKHRNYWPVFPEEENGEF